MSANVQVDQFVGESSRQYDRRKTDVIVPHESSFVKQRAVRLKSRAGDAVPKRRRRKLRRQSHESAWHSKQTDNWYYTLPGSKKRVPLFDEDENRIRGIDNKKAAQLALARVKRQHVLPLPQPQKGAH
jgi:hypothetical protein